MNTHYGEIIERTIRRNGYSISELARILNVNRRTVYNWFLQRNLKPEIIYRIGCALRHDFSAEFPHLFSKEDFQEAKQVKAVTVDKMPLPEADPGIENLNHWQNKYILLLEEYNDMLLSQVERAHSSFSPDLQA